MQAHPITVTGYVILGVVLFGAIVGLSIWGALEIKKKTKSSFIPNINSPYFRKVDNFGTNISGVLGLKNQKCKCHSDSKNEYAPIVCICTESCNYCVSGGCPRKKKEMIILAGKLPGTNEITQLNSPKATTEGFSPCLPSQIYARGQCLPAMGRVQYDLGQIHQNAMSPDYAKIEGFIVDPKYNSQYIGQGHSAWDFTSGLSGRQSVTFYNWLNPMDLTNPTGALPPATVVTW
jgi:hypothetical protein